MKTKPMTDSELSAFVDDEVRNSLGYLSGELSTQRRLALDYYLGEPFGNEVEGRSSVVLTEVADTIEWIMPQLMRVFTSSDHTVKFEPTGPEDEEQAEQETDYVNYVFSKENKGFMALYSWFKDALLQKNGVIKVVWDESTKISTETYENLTDTELAELLEDDELEPTEHSEVAGEDFVQDPEGNLVPVNVTLHNVKFKRTSVKGKAIVMSIPPEEFLVSRKSVSIDVQESPFVAHRVKRTLSELRAMGYDEKKLDNIGSDETGGEYNEERVARFNLEDEHPDQWTNSTDPSQQEIWVIEAYPLVDFNGDGIAERRMVVTAGNVILENVEIDSVPFAVLCPIVMTHKYNGLSIADQVMDLQLIKSTILRQVLDNMYFVNNQRTAIDENRVDLDDLLTSRPGGVIRVKGDPGSAIMPMVTQPFTSHAFGMLDYLDTVKENRTGVTKYNQGLDANSLNKTASGISQIMNAAQQRIELIARMFAETGVKDMFLLLHGLLLKHQDKEKVVKLRGKWVDVSPSEWRERFNMTVTVGLGTGSKTEMIQQLMGLLDVQERMISAGGLGITVTPANIYNTVEKIVENMGLKEGTLYFQDPDSPEAKAAMEAQKNQPNPEAEMAQMQMQLEQQRVDIEGQKVKIDEQKLTLEAQDNELDKYKVDVDAQVKLAQSEAKSLSESNRQALDKYKSELDAETDKETKLAVAEIESQTKIRVEEMRILNREVDILNKEKARMEQEAGNSVDETARRAALEEVRLVDKKIDKLAATIENYGKKTQDQRNNILEFLEKEGSQEAKAFIKKLRSK